MIWNGLKKKQRKSKKIVIEKNIWNKNKQDIKKKVKEINNRKKEKTK